VKLIPIEIGGEIFEFCISSNNLPIFDEDNCGQIAVARLTADKPKYYYSVKDIQRGKSLLMNLNAYCENELHNNLESYRAALIKFNRLKIFMIFGKDTSSLVLMVIDVIYYIWHGKFSY
jgi:hypothetical protein